MLCINEEGALINVSPEQQHASVAPLIRISGPAYLKIVQHDEQARQLHDTRMLQHWPLMRSWTPLFMPILRGQAHHTQHFPPQTVDFNAQLRSLALRPQVCSAVTVRLSCADLHPLPPNLPCHRLQIWPA